METTIAVTRTILSGIWDRWTGLTVLLAHSGRTLVPHGKDRKLHCARLPFEEQNPDTPEHMGHLTEKHLTGCGDILRYWSKNCD